MAKERKMTPARFLKRNMPYLIMALIVLLLAGAVVLIIGQVKSLSPEQEQPAQSVQNPAQPDASPAQDSQSGQPDDAAADDVPQQDVTVYQPPFDGTVVLLASNQLITAYAEDALAYTAGAQLSSFVPLDGDGSARIDVQELGTSRKLLKSAELERICKGALQAYYYAAPATADISAEIVADTDELYQVQLTAAAYGGAPAVEAEVRLYELSGTLWCVSAVYPDGADCTSLRQTMQALTVRTADMVLESITK